MISRIIRLKRIVLSVASCSVMILGFQNCDKTQFSKIENGTSTLASTAPVSSCPTSTVPCDTDRFVGTQSCGNTALGPKYGTCQQQSCKLPFVNTQGSCQSPTCTEGASDPCVVQGNSGVRFCTNNSWSSCHWIKISVNDLSAVTLIPNSTYSFDVQVSDNSVQMAPNKTVILTKSTGTCNFAGAKIDPWTLNNNQFKLGSNILNYDASTVNQLANCSWIGKVESNFTGVFSTILVNAMDEIRIPSCSNGATNPPACSQFPACLNGANNPPTCNQYVSCTNGANNPPACNQFPACNNGATNPPTCNQFPACNNGATNPPTCSQFPACNNGATNPPTCNQFPACLNGANNPPTCTVFSPCTNGASNPPTCNQFPTCSNGAANFPTCTDCASVGKVYSGGSCYSQCTNGANNPPFCTSCASSTDVYNSNTGLCEAPAVQQKQTKLQINVYKSSDGYFVATDGADSYCRWNGFSGGSNGVNTTSALTPKIPICWNLNTSTGSCSGGEATCASFSGGCVYVTTTECLANPGDVYKTPAAPPATQVEIAVDKTTDGYFIATGGADSYCKSQGYPGGSNGKNRTSALTPNIPICWAVNPSTGNCVGGDSTCSAWASGCIYITSTECMR